MPAWRRIFATVVTETFRPSRLIFADDPLVTPARVLAREPDDELADLAADGRAAGAARVGPVAGNNAPVPAQQSRGRQDESAPARAGQQPARGCEQKPVARAELGPTCLPAQHGKLVPQHDDLQLFAAFRTRAQEHKLQQAAQRQLAKRPAQDATPPRSTGRDADPTRHSRSQNCEPS
jgi:hypothetical protein